MIPAMPSTRDYILIEAKDMNSCLIRCDAIHKEDGKAVTVTQYCPWRFRSEDGKYIEIQEDGWEEYCKGKQRVLERLQQLDAYNESAFLPKLLDTFEQDGLLYFVTERIEDYSLRQYIEKNGVIPLEQLWPLLLPIVEGLERMHEKGDWHHDLTAFSLRVYDSKIKLLYDVGRIEEEIWWDYWNHDCSESDWPYRHANPCFAPEQLISRQAQSQFNMPGCNIYNLAAVIDYCITRQLPPRALDRVLGDELVPPRRLGAVLSEDEETVLLKALEASPRERKCRSQSLDEFWRELTEPRTRQEKKKKGFRFLWWK